MSETGMAMMGSGTASGEDRAREAAEAAISSPLLEDINLAGAQGILVNVTAGMDLSIGEFQEVGNVIKQFASDEATVVVGTVIDPDMTNQIRVTVVATGLGRPVAKAATPPAATIPQVQPMRIVRQRGAGSDYPSGPGPGSPRPGSAASAGAPPDYSALDRPAAMRRAAVGDGLRMDAETEDLLDIPAFLRRQAD
jgi:cell division protein FtsZ